MKNKDRLSSIRMAAKLVLSLLLVFTMAFGLFQANAGAAITGIFNGVVYNVEVGQPFDLRFSSDAGDTILTTHHSGTLPAGLSEVVDAGNYSFVGVVGPGSVQGSPYRIDLVETNTSTPNITIIINVSRGTPYIEQTPVSGSLGNTAQLTQTAKNNFHNVIAQGSLHAPTLTYYSADPSVATVSNTGLVTFVGTGSTTVFINSSATDSYIAAAGLAVPVNSFPASPAISIQGNSLTVQQGEPLDVTVMLSGAYLLSGDSIDFAADVLAGISSAATATANGSVVFHFSALQTKGLTPGTYNVGIYQIQMNGNAFNNNNDVLSFSVPLLVTAGALPPTPVPTIEPTPTPNAAKTPKTASRTTANPNAASASEPVIPSEGIAETGGTFQVNATGTTETLVFSLEGAPEGVTIDPGTGLISVADTVAAGTYTFTIGVDDGKTPAATQTFTLTVEALSVSAAIHPPTAAFDRTNPADITVTLTPGDYTLEKITIDDVELLPGEAYTESEGVYTFSQAWLSGLSDGEHVLDFVMSDGTSLTVKLTIEDKAPDTVITGLPNSFALRVGDDFLWTPQPSGGTWSFDSEYLSMTQDGDSVSFKALKAGSTEATYTVGDVPHTVSVIINPSVLPWLIPTVLVVALGATGGIFLLRKKRMSRR